MQEIENLPIGLINSVLYCDLIKFLIQYFLDYLYILGWVEKYVWIIQTENEEKKSFSERNLTFIL